MPHGSTPGSLGLGPKNHSVAVPIAPAAELTARSASSISTVSSSIALDSISAMSCVICCAVSTKRSVPSLELMK